MNMIENHMEQVALSSAAIAELSFPPPRIFTNALLHPHDITALIRDTEAHERALFTFTPPEPASLEARSRKSTFRPNGGGDWQGKPTISGLKPTTAVARILGGDLVDRIRRRDKEEEGGKSDLDVEALLKGAEKLCAVYPIAGALDKIASLRSRHAELARSVHEYEALVADQASKLNRMNMERDDDDLNDYAAAARDPKASFSLDDLRREEEEVRELEEKKRILEERVSGMEKDLGGLSR